LRDAGGDQTQAVAGSRRWEVGNATLVLLGMATFVAVVYVVVVRGGGALLGRADSPSPALSVLATAIVALGFQPVARRVRPVAARLARRERAAPYEVLTRFRTDVGGGYGTDELPGRMARLLAEATRARYAQVWLAVDGRPTLAATWPTDAAAAEASPPDPMDPAQSAPGRRALPVRHADELLGILVVQEHDRQPLTPVEHQLFAGLAAQAGLVLRSVRLRAGLANRLAESTRRAAELRRSRERIVAAQDQERRRLERDIHDGAQQHLVALAVNLRLARTLAAKSPERMLPMLADLRSAAVETIETLRDLSRGIYPRKLTESGLKAALEAAVAAGSMPVELSIDAMDRPPHDIEAALYFCCLEALQNAAKHSGATRATVRVGRRGDGVEMTVSDDGRGFSLVAAGPGRGLLNMRDRAEAVGGSLRVDSQPGRGTVIGVRLPLATVPPGGP
jgi:signal transduction histidine kinase